MMSVHLYPFLPPASLASSSLATPVRRAFFLPSVFARVLLCCSIPRASTFSRMPQPLTASLKNFSDRSHELPNFLQSFPGASVIFSFVCDENAGFSIRQLTKILT